MGNHIEKARHYTTPEIELSYGEWGYIGRIGKTISRWLSENCGSLKETSIVDIRQGALQALETQGETVIFSGSYVVDRNHERIDDLDAFEQGIRGNKQFQTLEARVETASRGRLSVALICERKREQESDWNGGATVEIKIVRGK